MEMYDAGYITNIYNSSIHSKVMLIEAKDGTRIVIESSANCNMNPRVEQSCVTVSDELFRFYDVYLHGILDEEEARYVGRKTAEQLTETRYGTESDLSDTERTALLGED